LYRLLRDYREKIATQARDRFDKVNFGIRIDHVVKDKLPEDSDLLCQVRLTFGCSDNSRFSSVVKYHVESKPRYYNKTAMSHPRNYEGNMRKWRNLDEDQ